MNPYFQTYTAPDGSTRRPIVERVPETRPEGLTVEMTEDGRFIACFVDGDYMPHERVPLALCRVACEDWIRNNLGDEGLYIGPTCRHRADEGKEMVAFGWGSDTPETFGAETIHDALNAAAHAVADEMAVLP